ncbi:chromosome segregation in meiosis- protein [Maudiozyma exigua]|uniref:Chromosome segregation in meiosis protein n=1 Tax=Maudiozyma exigua TaxID=34358 RepID=A0A9P6W4K9_MAUEX|nr:chromosome segregation in meiosis- protein [Kazachstania exigua]
MEQDDLMMNYGMDPAIPNIDSVTDSTNINPTVAADPTEFGSAALDPTVIAVKTRRPQVKLTTERLLSCGGLPYVMKNAPKSIKISSRRNAQQNLSGIVQFYQLWAHELFPKAKFRDFIKLCETLGKTDKTLREYRSNLYRAEMGIDPTGIPEDEEQFETQPIANDTEIGAESNQDLGNGDATTTGQPTLFVEQGSIEINNQQTNHPTTTNSQNNNDNDNLELDDDDDEDLYSISTFKSLAKKVVDDDNEETQQPSQYEMDELMKEMEQSGNAQPIIPISNHKENNDEDNFTDDEEALNDMEAQSREKEQPQNMQTSDTATPDSRNNIEENRPTEILKVHDKELIKNTDLMKNTETSENIPLDADPTGNAQNNSESKQPNEDEIHDNTEEQQANIETDAYTENTRQSEVTQNKPKEKDTENKEEAENTEEQYMDATMGVMSAYGF